MTRAVIRREAGTNQTVIPAKAGMNQSVIPAKAGIQVIRSRDDRNLGPGLRRGDACAGATPRLGRRLRRG